MRFDWDPSKAAANLKKHQVSFDEAKTVFFDDFAVQFFDEEHSETEERFIMLGMSSNARLLVVCHCEREDGEVIRIISARKATKRESAWGRKKVESLRRHPSQPRCRESNRGDSRCRCKKSRKVWCCAWQIHLPIVQHGRVRLYTLV